MEDTEDRADIMLISALLRGRSIIEGWFISSGSSFLSNLCHSPVAGLLLCCLFCTCTGAPRKQKGAFISGAALSAICFTLCVWIY